MSCENMRELSTRPRRYQRRRWRWRLLRWRWLAAAAAATAPRGVCSTAAYALDSSLRCMHVYMKKKHTHTIKLFGVRFASFLFPFFPHDSNSIRLLITARNKHDKRVYAVVVSWRFLPDANRLDARNQHIRFSPLFRLARSFVSQTTQNAVMDYENEYSVRAILNYNKGIHVRGWREQNIVVK